LPDFLPLRLPFPSGVADLSHMNKILVRKFLPYIIVFLGIAYGIWPLDIIPDVPIVGWIDDVGVFGVAIYIALLIYRKNKNTSKKN